MSPELIAVVEPFVRRGLFPNAEMAVAEIARDYVLRQIERYHAVETAFQARYGMTYEQFDDYLRVRSETLSKNPNPALNQAIMIEEDDALDWKIRATWCKVGWACSARCLGEHLGGAAQPRSDRAAGIWLLRRRAYPGDSPIL